MSARRRRREVLRGMFNRQRDRWQGSMVLIVALFVLGWRQSCDIDRLRKQRNEAVQRLNEHADNFAQVVKKLNQHTAGIDELIHELNERGGIEETNASTLMSVVRCLDLVAQWQTNVSAIIRERPSIEVHILPPNGLPELPLPPGLNAQEKVL